jgi:hypothetical protein
LLVFLCKKPRVHGQIQWAFLRVVCMLPLTGSEFMFRRETKKAGILIPAFLLSVDFLFILQRFPMLLQHLLLCEVLIVLCKNQLL